VKHLEKKIVIISQVHGHANNQLFIEKESHSRLYIIHICLASGSYNLEKSLSKKFSCLALESNSGYL